MRGCFNNSRRRGVAIVYIVVVLLVMLAFCSFAVDLGRVQTAKTELRRTADAAARAGVADLPQGTSAVQNAAIAMAANDKCDGKTVALTDGNITVGIWNGTTHTFSSTGTANNTSTYLAVQVLCSQSVPLLFGEILGMAHCTVNADSVAALVASSAPVTDYVSAHGNPWLSGAPAGTTGSEPDTGYGVPAANNAHPWKYDIANPADTDSSSKVYGDGSKVESTDYQTGEPYASPVPFTVTPGSILQISVPDDSNNVSTNSGYLSNTGSGISTYANGENDGSVAIYSDDAANPSMSQGTTTTSGSENNISNIESPLNAMLGVFTDGGVPSTESSAPTGLDFSTQAARDYSSGTTQSGSGATELENGSIDPSLRQSFYVGDGQTSSGTQETIIVPADATTLFLGTMDGHEWSNNQGGFNATITEFNIELVQ